MLARVLLRPPPTHAGCSILFWCSTLSHSEDPCVSISGSLGIQDTYAGYFEPKTTEILCKTGLDPPRSEKGGGECGLF